jgi:hypothetical protein
LRLAIAAEHALGLWAQSRGRVACGLYEFLRFGVKQAWASLFGALLLALIIATKLGTRNTRSSRGMTRWCWPRSSSRPAIRLTRRTAKPPRPKTAKNQKFKKNLPIISHQIETNSACLWITSKFPNSNNMLS